MIKSLVKKDAEIKYVIINKDNKNTYFRFKNNYLEISKAKYVSEASIKDFLFNNFDKFYNKYLEHLNSIPNEAEIILEEQSYKINLIQSNKFSYNINENIINVYSKAIDITKLKKLIYKNHLLKMIESISAKVNLVLNLNKIKQRPIKLKYYKSKFGSYNKKHDEITLNIVLAKANINYLYYVIMHEYAHTKEFNHSKSFYKVLKELMPNYKKYDKTIKNLSVWL